MVFDEREQGEHDNHDEKEKNGKFSVRDHVKDFLMVPLGGTGEIGMNVTMYHSNGKWLVIDLGVGFSDENLPGTDLMVADIGFIKQNRKNLLGLVLTHAHEDHFGALQYLWEDLQCPIYASPFTAQFMRAKLAAARIPFEIPIHEYSDDNPIINIGDFKLQMIRVTHSIPDAFAIVIETQGMRVYHSGDWKFDEKPVVGPATDLEAISKAGDEGIDVLVCDSTNVFNEDISGHEGDLADSFRSIMPNISGTIFVTMFASNIARVYTVAKTAAEIGRKVFLLGSAVNRSVEAARGVGYLQDLDNLLPIEEIDDCPRNEAVIICTGCQGEPLATMSKIIENKIHGIDIRPEDGVLFSSVIIPGNETRVNRVINAIAATGASLFLGKPHNIHVSGHPGKPDLMKLHQMLRPKVVIPVHGEIVHLKQHAKLAKEWGANDTLVINNGAVVKISPSAAEVIGEVKAGRFAVDGKFLRAPDSDVMKARRVLMSGGVVFVVILLCGETGSLFRRPFVTAPGLLDPKNDSRLLEGIAKQIGDGLANKNNMNPHAVTNAAFSIVRRICKEVINKYPEIKVHVERV